MVTGARLLVAQIFLQKASHVSLTMSTMCIRWKQRQTLAGDAVNDTICWLNPEWRNVLYSQQKLTKASLNMAFNPVLRVPTPITRPFHGNRCNTVKQSLVQFARSNASFTEEYRNTSSQPHRSRASVWVTLNTKTVWPLFITNALISFMCIGPWNTQHTSLFGSQKCLCLVPRSVILPSGWAIFKDQWFLRHYRRLASLSQKHNFRPLPFF